MNRRQLVRLAVILVPLSLLLLFAVTHFAAVRLTRPSNYPIGPPPKDIAFEQVHIKSQSGSRLSGWLHASGDDRALAILMHPAHGNRAAMLGRARLLMKAGFTVLLADFQAHGESHGKQFTAGYLERLDAVALIGFAAERRPDLPIVVVGWSLGGAAALLADARARDQVDAFVLEAVYPSIEVAIHNRMTDRAGFLGSIMATPLAWQLSHQQGIDMNDLRPIDAISSLQSPVLILAGEADVATTPQDSRNLFAAANEPKQLVFFPGAEHTDLYRADQELWKNNVLGFLIEHLP